MKLVKFEMEHCLKGIIYSYTYTSYPMQEYEVDEYIQKTQDTTNGNHRIKSVTVEDIEE